MSDATHNEQSQQASALEDRIAELTLQLEQQQASNQKVVQTLEGQLMDAQYVIIELSGTVGEYQAMPCESLRTRMFQTLRRYGERIKEHRSLYRATAESGNLRVRMATQESNERLEREVEHQQVLMRAVLDDAMDQVEDQVHVCDKNNPEIKSRKLSPNMLAVYMAIPDAWEPK